MRHTKLMPRPRILVHPEVVKIECDLCHEEIPLGRLDRTRDDVTISHDKGGSCHVGDWGDRLEIDVCGPCFEAKVLPALASLGLPTEYKGYVS